MANDLKRLVVEEADLAEADLADALEPYLRFTSDGQLLLEDGFEALSAKDRVLCLLLGLRAMEMLGLRPQATAKPAEIVRVSGMPPGTVRPKLSQLTRERYATKGADGYSLPLHSARRAVRILSEINDH